MDTRLGNVQMMIKVKNLIFMVMAFVFFLLLVFCQGCLCDFSNKVIIDKQFLCDIERAFQEEANLGCQKHLIYNTLWEEYYYELIYLAEKGDHKAIDVSIMLIGQKVEPTCLVEDIELLVKPTYESDTDYFWKSLKNKDTATQVKVLNVFEHCKPLDWDMQWYFTKFPKIKELYDSKYGKEGR